ncbi:MAG: AEC family transporter [Proteobacteria bacterium]|nr:AEC family transporter [Pseudomonadota bacterium]NOG59017.1 AEC family transporter [Pseudomonadota bacterium]
MISIRIFEISFPIFTIVLAGLFYARKFKPDMTLSNRLNMDVFIPCLLFSVIYEKAGVSGLFGNLALGIALVVLLSGIIALVIAKLFQINAKTLCPPIMFANAGNLGLPLVILSFGDVALSAAVICFVVCNFLHITIVSYWLNKQPNLFKTFLTPLIMAVVLAVILSLLEIKIPNTVLEPIRMMGNICVPLMLFALGTRLIDLKLSEWKTGMLAALLAPICGVAIVLAILPFIELTRLEQGALFLFGALPPAVMNYIFAEHYDQEPSKVAAMVLFGNAFCIISIPIALAYALPRFG